MSTSCAGTRPCYLKGTSLLPSTIWRRFLLLRLVVFLYTRETLTLERDPYTGERPKQKPVSTIYPLFRVMTLRLLLKNSQRRRSTSLYTSTSPRGPNLVRKLGSTSVSPLLFKFCKIRTDGKLIHLPIPGQISNAHTVWADRKKGGVMDTQCLTLAKSHSDAVDFVKTGIAPKFSYR